MSLFMALSSLPSPSIPSCPSSLVSSSSVEIASLSHDKIQAEILPITGAASLAQVNSSYPAIPVHVVSPGSPPPMLVSESQPTSWVAVTQGSSKPLTFHPPVLEDGKLKIPDPTTKNWILNSGLWHVAFKTLVMRRWELNYEVIKQDPKRVPIWVKLWKVPMEFLSMEGLSYIANAIGVPLALDKATEERARVDFAKVYVEIDVYFAQDLPEFILVDVEDFPSVEHKPQAQKKEWVEVTGKGKTQNSQPMQDGELAKKVDDKGTLVRPVKELHAKSPIVWSNTVMKEPMVDIQAVATVHYEQPIAELKSCKDGHNTLKSCKDGHNTFEVLANIDDEQVFPPLQVSSKSPKSLKKQRQASLRVVTVTNTLLPRQRNTKKVANSSSELPKFDTIAEFILPGWCKFGNYNYASLGLTDLLAFGPLLTWTNKREVGLIARKLDRLMVNSKWLEIFPNTRAEFLPLNISDHYAGSITIMESPSNHLRRSFKFFNFWTKDEQFLSIVQDIWSSVEVQGCYMFQLCRKLKALKASLRQLNKNSYGDLHERVIKETDKLHAIQIDLLSKPQEDLVIIEQEQAKRLADLTFAEEAFLKQKSRVHWLKEGDQNTTYFHKILKIRRCKNSIKELHSDDGKVFTQHVDIARKAIAFYQKLLGTEDPSCLGGELELLKTLFNFQLPNTMQQDLIQPVTTEEFKQIFFNSLNNKSPSPDGYTAEFYKSAWSIVGDLVTKAIKKFFSTRKLLKEVNSTIISLIPKVSCPSKMAEFRLISCCNLLCKCITKIIANRLKKCLPLFISNNQCAFVEGRLMVENILLAQELVKDYNKTNMQPICALKIDLMKAFDSVSWKFILAALEALSFPLVFINWIKVCITSPMFSIAINGALEGYFQGKKGVRQGDPLSPYLFVICMEVLSRFLNKAAQEGRLPFSPKMQ
ncbi:hypothetical protein SLEP1_g29545 [Rubroshorea leprosula]|uniref:Reverse transcriptase domain-containing protein n=1 Tax=Rubroshorea leprosula TaxID=152421 RepID=A0AAV5K7V0_9ROSI|nr:hypothetical protein SLEP1_g29545 [Rubroshorea leprosula]